MDSTNPMVCNLKQIMFVRSSTKIHHYILFRLGAVIVWQLDLQLHVQSVPITTKVVSSNPVHGEVYSIQHYLIKFVRFSPGTLVSCTNKTDRHDITEILLKVSLSTINHLPCSGKNMVVMGNICIKYYKHAWIQTLMNN